MGDRGFETRMGGPLWTLNGSWKNTPSFYLKKKITSERTKNIIKKYKGHSFGIVVVQLTGTVDHLAC